MGAGLEQVLELELGLLSGKVQKMGLGFGQVLTSRVCFGFGQKLVLVQGEVQVKVLLQVV